MEQPIILSELNDFIFCPASIYFHHLYDDTEQLLFQCSDQISGRHSHEAVDSGHYSNRKNILQGITVYCEKYNLTGKIDTFDVSTGHLVERKKKISRLFDGQIFQIWGQFFSLQEMGYVVKKMTIRSLDDNKNYAIPFPNERQDLLASFEKMLHNMQTFELASFVQTSSAKCSHCIYEPICDRAVARHDE